MEWILVKQQLFQDYLMKIGNNRFNITPFYKYNVYTYNKASNNYFVHYIRIFYLMIQLVPTPNFLHPLSNIHMHIFPFQNKRMFQHTSRGRSIGRIFSQAKNKHIFDYISI